MSTPTTPRPVSELGAPLSRLAADVHAIVARQRACQVLAEAAEHSSSPSDRIAYALDGWLVRHPEAHVSTNEDYPGWTPDGARTGIPTFLATLSGGDLPADAVREERCLRQPIGCGQPLIAADGTTRVFWDEAEAARYQTEWQITGLCPDCQDALDGGDDA